MQGPPRIIDLSVRSLPVRCVQLVEDQVGFSVVQFSSCSLNSAFFLVLPGQPTAWVCVFRDLSYRCLVSARSPRRRSPLAVSPLSS